MCAEYRRPSGFTLPELLLMIVVFGIALGGILTVYNTTVLRSVDPMVRKQAMAIAESMMEEVLAQPYAVIGSAPSPKNQTTRATFDDARDYDGFQTTGAYSIENPATPIPGLENYNVAVSVTSASVGGIAGALEVTVTVTGPLDTTYVLTGHKYN